MLLLGNVDRIPAFLQANELFAMPGYLIAGYVAVAVFLLFVTGRLAVRGMREIDRGERAGYIKMALAAALAVAATVLLAQAELGDYHL